MANDDLIRTLDEFEAEYRSGIGTTLPHRPTKEANLDNIRRFGDGVGDYNPLWRDQAHAAASRFGMVTAPPPFLYSVTLGVVAGETGAIDRRRVSTQYLPVNYAGAEIDFIRPIWLGDRITSHEQVGETLRKRSGRIGPINFNTGHVTFTNQRQEVVATIKTLMARYENTGHTLDYDRAAKGEGGSPVEPVSEPADPLVWERERRGAETRYFEDVAEGDVIPSLPRAPTRSQSCSCLRTACSAQGAARGLLWRRKVRPILAVAGASTPNMRRSGATCRGSSTTARSACAG